MKTRYCLTEKMEAVTCMPLEIPKIIYVEVSRKCNLYCKHCFNYSGPKEPLPDFSYFENIRQQLTDVCIKEVIISGGEPFIRPDILDIVDLFCNDCDVKILTNGTKLKESDIAYLIRRKIKIQITLNGATKEIDVKMRRTGYEETVSAIEKVIELGGRDLLYTTTAISKCNYEDLENYTDFLVKLGVKNIQFSMVKKNGRAIKNWDSLGLSLFENITALQCIAQIKKKYPNHYFVTSGLSRMNSFLVENEENNCEYFTEEICFAADGTISLCPRISIFSECNEIKPTYNGIGISRTELSGINYKKCKDCEAYSNCLVGCLDNEGI